MFHCFKNRLVGPAIALVAIVSVSLASAQEAETQRSFGGALSAAAIERTTHVVSYDAGYEQIDYPMGDVAFDRGVCSDVVVRSLRGLGIDLQKLVHEDMSDNFASYPRHWGLSRPDSNIDHRRVPNLEHYFRRKGARISISDHASDYQPGDIVAWNLRGENGGWLPHIGVVTDRNGSSGRPLIVHNIGAGPKLEDVLFDWPMTGHYRLTYQTFAASN